VISERRRVVTALVGVTILLVVVLGIRPVATPTIVAGYVLVVAAIAIGSLTRVAGGDRDIRVSAFEQALAERDARPTRPSELIRVERELTLGMSNAGHLHHRLIPMLRDVARARTDGTLTQARLGDELWQLLRPDRPEPVDRHAPGASARELQRVVSLLEGL